MRPNVTKMKLVYRREMAFICRGPTDPGLRGKISVVTPPPPQYRLTSVAEYPDGLESMLEPQASQWNQGVHAWREQGKTATNKLM